MCAKVAVLREKDELENRVSMVPELLDRAAGMGLQFLVEKDAGKSSFFSDEDYARKGGVVSASRDYILKESDIVVTLQRPDEDDIGNMRPGTVLVGTILPSFFPGLVKKLADAKITAFSLELMPRITRAQTMDVLSSQSSVAGYRAAILGAMNSPRIMPMLTTAAGTVRPSSVFVIGAGVAGLMAIATSKRLGAAVTAFDVRKTAGDDVRSLGARFLETSFDAVGKGGYARDLTAAEREEQNDMLEKAVSGADVVITAASVPGKAAPKIVTRKMVETMRPGSVIIDLSSESGGNCELTEPGKTVVNSGVKIVGQSNLPSEVPFTSSMLYSRNMLSFLELLVDGDGNLKGDYTDEKLKECLITHNGKVTFEPLNEGGKG